MSQQTSLRRELVGDIAVMILSGEIDVATRPEIEQALRAQFPAEAVGMVLDLTDVTFLDSSAVQMLFELHEDLGQSRRALSLVLAPGALPRRSIEICDGSGVLDLHATREDALRAVGGGSWSAV
ncbi:MAG TPA: STAS domain-containing protein [Solirubrobacteraceae bacterium]|nr:STAS domain-containing protein [Solirubrobacteraceae bacterium]